MSFLNINATRDARVLQRLYLLEKDKKNPEDKKIKENIRLWELIHERKI